MKLNRKLDDTNLQYGYKELESVAYDYYKNELEKLTDLELVSIRLSDYGGNHTKTLTLNEESLAALLELFNKMQAKKEAV